MLLQKLGEFMPAGDAAQRPIERDALGAEGLLRIGPAAAIRARPIVGAATPPAAPWCRRDRERRHDQNRPWFAIALWAFQRATRKSRNALERSPDSGTLRRITFAAATNAS